MVRVLIFGVMGEAMKVNITKIENMVSVFTNGLMVVYMKDIGIQENKMEKENTH